MEDFKFKIEDTGVIDEIEVKMEEEEQVILKTEDSSASSDDDEDKIDPLAMDEVDPWSIETNEHEEHEVKVEAESAGTSNVEDAQDEAMGAPSAFDSPPAYPISGEEWLARRRAGQKPSWLFTIPLSDYLRRNPGSIAAPKPSSTASVQPPNSTNGNEQEPARQPQSQKGIMRIRTEKPKCSKCGAEFIYARAYLNHIEFCDGTVPR